jgi:hypothetical protein
MWPLTCVAIHSTSAISRSTCTASLRYIEWLHAACSRVITVLALSGLSAVFLEWPHMPGSALDATGCPVTPISLCAHTPTCCTQDANRTVDLVHCAAHCSCSPTSLLAIVHAWKSGAEHSCVCPHSRIDVSHRLHMLHFGLRLLTASGK